jgi:hypothetical protein
MNLSDTQRKAIGIVVAAFVGGVLSAFFASGGDVFSTEPRVLLNAGIGAAGTVILAWLLPLYKGIGIGSETGRPKDTDGPFDIFTD